MTYDAAIIGGGLAGCSAAITLAQQGKRVVLFESKAYPHHKVCGEFLSPECLHYLDDLGVMPALRSLHPAPVHTVAITTPDGTQWETHLPGLSVSRYRLDHLLAQRAEALGVEIHTSTTVTRIEGDLHKGFRIQTRPNTADFRAKTVIAAHGKRSNLDRALNRRFLRKPQPFTGLKAHFYGAPLSGRVELHTFPGGYCGLGEIEDGLTNVCLLVRTEVFRRAGDIDSLVAWMRAQNPQLERWFKSARMVGDGWLSISQIPFLTKRVLEGDILMAGDAAGLITPLTGDGMSMALRGGQMAAQHLSQYLEGRLTAAQLREGYAAEWKHAFRSRLWLGRALQVFMLNPPLLAFGLRVLNRMPRFGRYLVYRTRDVAYLTG
ncbi:MAG TPA: NAD(P)/FAD-dependent oxidoreductase [Oceanobacillus sp.]|nr:NAD(P)/FAD-dependent oxidoreductase [Oceanobacillus sp.]